MGVKREPGTKRDDRSASSGHVCGPRSTVPAPLGPLLPPLTSKVTSDAICWFCLCLIGAGEAAYPVLCLTSPISLGCRSPSELEGLPRGGCVLRFLGVSGGGTGGDAQVASGGAPLPLHVTPTAAQGTVGPCPPVPSAEALGAPLLQSLPSPPGLCPRRAQGQRAAALRDVHRTSALTLMTVFEGRSNNSLCVNHAHSSRLSLKKRKSDLRVGS